MKNLLLSLITLSMFASCSITSHHNQSNKKFSTTKASSVKVYALTGPKRKYEVLGPVFADSQSSDLESAKRLLKKKCAEIGAHAAINTQAYKFTSWTRAGLKATAIRYID